MNIFIELNKYRPRENLTPEENFFTQSFKIILEQYREIAKEIITFLSNNKIQPNYKFETQKVYEKSIVDMVITGHNHNKLLLEIKVEAGESSDKQIQKYLNLQKGYVAVISKYDINPIIIKHKEQYLGLFYWSSIHSLIKKYIYKNNIQKDELLYQFLSYMESKGMNSFDGISTTVHYSTWANYQNMFLTFRNILTEIQEHFNKFHYELSGIKEKYQWCDAHFTFFPQNRLKAFKKFKITPYIGIFIYDEKIWKSGYQIDYKNDVYLYIEFVNGNNSFGDENISEIKRGVFYSRYTSHWIIETPLKNVIGKESNPDRQIKKIIEFYMSSLKLLNKNFDATINI